MVFFFIFLLFFKFCQLFLSKIYKSHYRHRKSRSYDVTQSNTSNSKAFNLQLTELTTRMQPQISTSTLNLSADRKFPLIFVPPSINLVRSGLRPLLHVITTVPSGIYSQYLQGADEHPTLALNVRKLPQRFTFR